MKLFTPIDTERIEALTLGKESQTQELEEHSNFNAFKEDFISAVEERLAALGNAVTEAESGCKAVYVHYESAVPLIQKIATAQTEKLAGETVSVVEKDNNVGKIGTIIANHIGLQLLLITCNIYSEQKGNGPETPYETIQKEIDIRQIRADEVNRKFHQIAPHLPDIAFLEWGAIKIDEFAKKAAELEADASGGLNAEAEEGADFFMKETQGELSVEELARHFIDKNAIYLTTFGPEERTLVLERAQSLVVLATMTYNWRNKPVMRRQIEALNFLVTNFGPDINGEPLERRYAAKILEVTHQARREARVARKALEQDVVVGAVPESPESNQKDDPDLESLRAAIPNVKTKEIKRQLGETLGRIVRGDEGVGLAPCPELSQKDALQLLHELSTGDAKKAYGVLRTLQGLDAATFKSGEHHDFVIAGKWLFANLPALADPKHSWRTAEERTFIQRARQNLQPTE